MITKSIQDLWSSMQDPNASGHILIVKADKIKQTVHQLLDLFPEVDCLYFIFIFQIFFILFILMFVLFPEV